MNKLFIVAIALSLIISPSVCSTHEQVAPIIEQQAENVVEKPIENNIVAPEIQHNSNPQVIEELKEKILQNAAQVIEEEPIVNNKEIDLGAAQQNKEAGLLKSEKKAAQGEEKGKPEINQAGEQKKPEEMNEDDRRNVRSLGEYILWGVAGLGIVSIAATIFIMLKK